MKKRLVNEKRVRVLKQGKVGAGPVIYWCSRDQRVQDNWALIYACEAAKSTSAPVAVVFSLVTSFLGAGARQFCFMLKGLQEMEKALHAMNIKFVLLEGDPSLTVPKSLLFGQKRSLTAPICFRSSCPFWAGRCPPSKFIVFNNWSETKNAALPRSCVQGSKSECVLSRGFNTPEKASRVFMSPLIVW